MPGKGAPHAIFLPRQKRQARGGFFSGVVLESIELRPNDGDAGDFKRYSAGGGDDGQGVTGVTGDVSDGVGCDRMSCGLSCTGESISLRSDDSRSRDINPSWQFGEFNVGNCIRRFN